MKFDVVTINRVYGLKDDDSEAYRALFQSPDYDLFLWTLTKWMKPWKRNPQIVEVTIFPKAVLKLVLKAWFLFLYSHLMSSLHVSIVQRDKAILLYVIVQDIKFDFGFVIENSILKAFQNRSTGALTHPSLITLLCKLAGVPMPESEEMTSPKIPVLVPKTKASSTSQDMDVDNDEEGGVEGVEEAKESE